MAAEVLISSAGRRVALVRAFREAGAVVHACDLTPDISAACHVADSRHAVPHSEAPGFIEAIAAVTRRHGIGLIVPTIDTELPAFAAASHHLLAAGVRVHVSPPEVIAVARDKHRCMAAFGAAGVAVPTTLTEAELRAAPDRLDWPVFGKPAAGSASRGVGIYRRPGDLPPAFPEAMIFQPRLDGPEYTVNIFVDAAGRLRCAIPHRRLQIRAGEVEKGVTERRADLRALAEGVVAALPAARGAMCFQVIDDARLGPVVIELNARFGGGYPLAHRAGARFADWLLAELRGDDAAHDDWRAGVTMLRYDDAVFID